MKHTWKYRVIISGIVCNDIIGKEEYYSKGLETWNIHISIMSERYVLEWYYVLDGRVNNIFWV